MFPIRSTLEVSWKVGCGFSALCWVLLFGSVGCNKAGQTHRARHPEFFEVYSIRGAPDASHTIAIVDKEAATWYRERSPSLNLSHLDIGRVTVLPPERNGIRMILKIATEHVSRFGRWTEQRVGFDIGVMIDGELHSVARLEERIGNVLAIWFTSLEQAQRVKSALEGGGEFGPGP